MTITGLENNYYLFNNTVQVVVNGFGLTNIKYLEVIATNNYNSKTMALRFYPLNNEFAFDISTLVKSTFDYPNNDLLKNLNNITFDFNAVDELDIIETTSIDKYFIRGGNFKGFYPNGTIKQNYINNFDFINILISEKIPRWIGKIIEATQITDDAFTTTSFNPSLFFEIQEIPCNGKYVKFLNSLGTYSYWFFEGFENKKDTKALDLINSIPYTFTDNNFFDLGVTVESEIEIRTQVPERFNDLMLHLIISPEVYIVEEDNSLTKIKQKNQKWFYNPIDKVFEYKFTFEIDNIINPSLLC